jgi:hypothetical protein
MALTLRGTIRDDGGLWNKLSTQGSGDAYAHGLALEFCLTSSQPVNNISARNAIRVFIGYT